MHDLFTRSGVPIVDPNLILGPLKARSGLRVELPSGTIYFLDEIHGDIFD